MQHSAYLYDDSNEVPDDVFDLLGLAIAILICGLVLLIGITVFFTYVVPIMSIIYGFGILEYVKYADVPIWANFITAVAITIILVAFLSHLLRRLL